MVFARKEEHAGACSEGFKTTEFPADIAPITGSNASAVPSRELTQRVVFPQLYTPGRSIYKVKK